MKPPSWLPYLALAAALIVIGWCGRSPDTTKLELDRERLNQRIATMRTDSIARESVEVIHLARIAQLDSQIANDRSRRRELNVVRDSLKVVLAGYDSLVPRELVGSLVATQDSVITSLVAENRQVTEQRDLWRAVAMSRDTTLRSANAALHEALRQRDAYRGRVPSSMERWATFGGGALMGYGLAEENETVVLVGAVTVLAPQVVRLVGKVF